MKRALTKEATEEGVVSSDNDQFRLSGSPACNQPWVAIAVRGKKLIENKITPGIEDRILPARLEQSFEKLDERT